MVAASSSGGDGVVLVVVCLYFLPTIIAMARKVPNTGSVVVVNLLLGWTIIGWVVALAMAARASVKSNSAQAPEMGRPTVPTVKAESALGPMHRECPSCKEPMRRDASVCPHCRNPSDPWQLNDGVWWRKIAGEWNSLDETTGAWSPAKTPQEPAATSTAALDASLDEIEELAALRARGVLTDAEYQAAKGRLLGS